MAKVVIGFYTKWSMWRWFWDRWNDGSEAGITVLREKKKKRNLPRTYDDPSIIVEMEVQYEEPVADSLYNQDAGKVLKGSFDDN